MGLKRRLKVVETDSLEEFVSVLLDESGKLDLPLAVHVLVADETELVFDQMNHRTVAEINQINKVDICIYDSLDEVFRFIEEKIVERPPDHQMVAFYDVFNDRNKASSRDQQQLLYYMSRLSQQKMASVYLTAGNLALIHTRWLNKCHS